MFSATLHSEEVKDVAGKICQKPIVVDLKVCRYKEHQNLVSDMVTCSGDLYGSTKAYADQQGVQIPVLTGH